MALKFPPIHIKNEFEKDSDCIIERSEKYINSVFENTELAENVKFKALKYLKLTWSPGNNRNLFIGFTLGKTNLDNIEINIIGNKYNDTYYPLLNIDVADEDKARINTTINFPDSNIKLSHIIQNLMRNTFTNLCFQVRTLNTDNV